MSLFFESNYEVASDIVSRKNKDGTVVLMRMDDSELFYKIDGLAASVFVSIDDKKNLNDWYAEQLQKFPAEAQRLFEDSQKFLKKLLEMKIIFQKN